MNWCCMAFKCLHVRRCGRVRALGQAAGTRTDPGPARPNHSSRGHQSNLWARSATSYEVVLRVRGRRVGMGRRTGTTAGEGASPPIKQMSHSQSKSKHWPLYFREGLNCSQPSQMIWDDGTCASNKGARARTLPTPQKITFMVILGPHRKKDKTGISRKNKSPPRVSTEGPA